MKRSFYTTTLIAALMSLSLASFAGSTYNITSNKDWSSVMPSTCAGCTINVSSNVTLTIDASVTCQNCSFNGGNIVMNSKTLNLQYSGSLTTTTFSSVKMTINGNGQVIVNAPLSLTGSTFAFNNTSYFNTSYEVDLSTSAVYLNDNATMMSTGGSSTPINLISNSQITIGNGSQTSNAVFTVSGPTLALYDNSMVNIGNVNNAYNNWSSYDYHPNIHSSSSATKTKSTLNNSLNCGGTAPHACANPSVYGPSSLSSAGAVANTTLPVVLVGFSTTLNSDKTVTLDWTTQMEVNSNEFIVERSADGDFWSAIGAVGAKGNSSTVSSYVFTDASPLAGTNFYRLRMTNLDNSYGYTEVKVVRTGMVSAVSFFPNPAKEYVNVSLGSTGTTSAKVDVRLINMAGQVMQEKTTRTGAGVVVTFSVGNFPAGVYILSVVDANGTQESRQLMITK
ncbi:MAG: T9SS type A sorting domain-containing protein [Bacteroidetes bacterium]|nr:T9SS type A sorting domain-containing protein [Bacteroidota bacterium]